MEDCNGQRDHRFYFVIFIFGNFRLTAAMTEAYSGFPELLANIFQLHPDREPPINRSGEEQVRCRAR
jgi:hypothetical protein